MAENISAHKRMQAEKRRKGVDNETPAVADQTSCQDDDPPSVSHDVTADDDPPSSGSNDLTEEGNRAVEMTEVKAQVLSRRLSLTRTRQDTITALTNTAASSSLVLGSLPFR